MPCDAKVKAVCERGQNTHHVDLGVCDGNPCNFGNCIGFYNTVEEKADFQCICKSGHSGRFCENAQCNCFAWGDPHFGTCDGHEYDYHGLCKYVMAQDGCADASERTFQVVIDTVPFPKYPGTSRTLKVFLLMDWVDGSPMERITLDAGHSVSHNGKTLDGACTLTNGVEISYRDRKTLVKLRDGVAIRWDGSMRIDVDIEGEHMGKVCGMCGNFNGDKEDDIRDANGDGKVNQEDEDVFGNYWQWDKDCDAVPQIPPSIDDICAAASPEAQAMVSEMSELLNSALFEDCVAAVAPEEIERTIHNIKMEGCSTGEKLRVCEVLRSLQLVCERHEIYFCWDPQGECGAYKKLVFFKCISVMQKHDVAITTTKFSNTSLVQLTDHLFFCDRLLLNTWKNLRVHGLVGELGDNESYFCGEGAELQCGDSDDSVLERWIPNYDGPKCNEGYRRLQGKCVLPEACGCKITASNGEQFMLKPNNMRLDPMCVAEYSCSFNNELQVYTAASSIHGCHADADCFDGECICRPLYVGNGYECVYESDPNVDELEGTNLGVSCGGYVADSSITLNPPQTLRDPTTSAIAGRLCIEDDFFMPPEDEEFPYIQIDQGVGVPVRAIIIRGYFDIQCWPASVEVYYSSDAENWECSLTPTTALVR
ncbi:sea star footprint protein 1 [Apostichopus japonicus]|uniref:Sea star footprint protein 1 n=1 Tax=Stichopus japonicus TaxID=307972 RepID=A0A2G8JQE4_STIJA|nr:sea star footprint protein 1 [Apostichopus japonicus]